MWHHVPHWSVPSPALGSPIAWIHTKWHAKRKCSVWCCRTSALHTCPKSSSLTKPESIWTVKKVRLSWIFSCCVATRRGWFSNQGLLCCLCRTVECRGLWPARWRQDLQVHNIAQFTWESLHRSPKWQCRFQALSAKQWHGLCLWQAGGRKKWLLRKLRTLVLALADSIFDLKMRARNWWLSLMQSLSPCAVSLSKAEEWLQS